MDTPIGQFVAGLPGSATRVEGQQRAQVLGELVGGNPGIPIPTLAELIFGLTGESILTADWNVYASVLSTALAAVWGMEMVCEPPAHLATATMKLAAAIRRPLQEIPEAIEEDMEDPGALMEFSWGHQATGMSDAIKGAIKKGGQPWLTGEARDLFKHIPEYDDLKPVATCNAKRIPPDDGKKKAIELEILNMQRVLITGMENLNEFDLDDPATEMLLTTVALSEKLRGTITGWRREAVNKQLATPTNKTDLFSKDDLKLITDETNLQNKLNPSSGRPFRSGGRGKGYRGWDSRSASSTPYSRSQSPGRGKGGKGGGGKGNRKGGKGNGGKGNRQPQETSTSD
jgi:hypothetical protein